MPSNPFTDDEGWEYDWAGYVGITSHQRPMLLKLSDNVYAGLGYNGRGVPMATMMGKQLAFALGEGTPWGHTYVPAHGPGIRAGIETLAQALIGVDPRQSGRIEYLMDRTLPGHPYVKSSLRLTWLVSILRDRSRDSLCRIFWADVLEPPHV